MQEEQKVTSAWQYRPTRCKTSSTLSTQNTNVRVTVGEKHVQAIVAQG